MGSPGRRARAGASAKGRLPGIRRREESTGVGGKPCAGPVGTKKARKTKNPVNSSELTGLHAGRSERIRTSGPCLPKAVLYQAELHSVRTATGWPVRGGFIVATGRLRNDLFSPFREFRYSGKAAR